MALLNPGSGLGYPAAAAPLPHLAIGDGAGAAAPAVLSALLVASYALRQPAAEPGSSPVPAAA